MLHRGICSGGYPNQEMPCICSGVPRIRNAYPIISGVPICPAPATQTLLKNWVIENWVGRKLGNRCVRKIGLSGAKKMALRLGRARDYSSGAVQSVCDDVQPRPVPASCSGTVRSCTLSDHSRSPSWKSTSLSGCATRLWSVHWNLGGSRPSNRDRFTRAG